MVGVTSTEKTYAISLSYLEYEKKDNFRWAIEVFRSLLKEQVEMPKTIVIDRDTALMNTVTKAGLNYIFHEAKRGETVGSDIVKCDFIITRMYGLPCDCVIAKKVKLGEPIRMDEVIPHWKRLSFDDDGCIEGEKSNISITSELEAIKERFTKVSDNLKLHIEEQLRKIGYPKTIDMKLPSQPVKTKGAPKKLKPTPNDNSTTRAPSYSEHVNKLFPDSPTPKSPKSQTSSNKGARISKPPPTPIPPKIPVTEEMPIPPKIPFINEMSVFMLPYIERIINVAGDVNCGYRTVSALLGNGEDSHTFLRHQLIKEFKTHKESYTRLYGEEVKFEAINEALVPWLGAYASVSKWMRFQEMGHLTN
ncbi:uncharacterized protein LOC131653062 [Vicia villosa]|uniref:uncharacterized protein LOC131653062 n=1 Tax=Vicia villosa TaxID=3911 RepID=UPI00273CE9B5|nr:uncharacterized protein LOC131653062 [Vicia villosa]